MVFRADSVRFEPCPAFRAASDPQLCDCGWLEHEHVGAVATTGRVRRFPRRRPVRVPQLQAS